MGLGAGGRDAAGHFAEIGIGPAVDIVMQIVELADGGESGFKHLHICESRDRLDVIGRKVLQETIHDLAPGPEAVGGRTTAFGEPGHAALESMTMQVGKAWNGDAGDAMRTAAHAFRGRNDDAVVDRNADVAGPSGRQQSMIEKELASQLSLSSSGRYWTRHVARQ
jgi:hypothetical protein